MSRRGKIDWKRLRYAAKETILAMVAGLIFICLMLSPAIICFLTETLWPLIIYPVVFFVVETWEKYNGF
jgi:hypothetical protein